MITCRGKDISFSVSATGGNIKYQWLKNNISLSDNDFISGVNTNKLIIKQAQLKDTADYLCLLSNACGDTMTAPAKLIVNDTTFKIIENPVTFIKCAGEKGALSVKAEDNNSFFYQWYKEDKLIKNATADTYKIDSLTKQDENFYYCILNNGCVKKSTDTVFILVNLPPVINVAAITTEKQIGDIVVFSLSPSGTPPFTYQWKKNNIIIEDEKEDKLVINPVQLSDAGVYSCLVGNECGSKENEVATLNVKDTVPETFLIYGNVNYDNIDKTVLPGVKVYLNSEAKSELKDSTITDEAGFFQFVAKKGNYFISAKYSKAVKGLDPIDALIINRYYLGAYKFSSPLRLKAANVSNDAIVNPIDALMIIRFYLGILKKFPSGPWLFEEPHFTVENAEININFRGICYGDVNGSYPK
ncbi:MAG: immunoglobulin domain-containing protein [Bacteroidales bacterium]|nr:immunoglobulin domain-containing protein [Bacteroidales bacterium]